MTQPEIMLLLCCVVVVLCAPYNSKNRMVQYEYFKPTPTSEGVTLRIRNIRRIDLMRVPILERLKCGHKEYYIQQSE